MTYSHLFDYKLHDGTDDWKEKHTVKNQNAKIKKLLMMLLHSEFGLNDYGETFDIRHWLDPLEIVSVRPDFQDHEGIK